MFVFFKFDYFVWHMYLFLLCKFIYQNIIIVIWVSKAIESCMFND